MEKWFILMWQFIFSFPNEYWKHFPCNIYKHALPSFTFGTFWLSNFSDSGNKPIEYFIQHAYHRMLGEIFDRFKHFQNLQKMTKWQMLDESLFRIILSSNTLFNIYFMLSWFERGFHATSCHLWCHQVFAHIFEENNIIHESETLLSTVFYFWS